jgi:drug/metabolite transporter (DMT)-like permease
MKYSMENQGKILKKRNAKGHTIFNRYWMSGFFCIAIASACNIIAIGYGSLVLLASMSAVTILFNSLLAVCMLNEVFTRWDALAVILIFIGCVCSSLFSKSDTSEFDHSDVFG